MVRVFHWSLAVFFLTAYFLEGNSLNLHVHVGYTVALLVLFRLIWGVIGSQTARFSNFVVWPWQSLRYLLQLTKGQANYYLGHNPAGATMIVALLFMLLLTAFSGMALYGLEGAGPLANTVVMSWPGGLLADLHELSADLCLALVIMHVLGVAFSSFLYRENLTRSMITGYKDEQHAKNSEGDEV